MPSGGWLGQNWFALAQTAVLATALFFVGGAVFLEARARRVSNLIDLTREHRDLWERIYARPELVRILNPAADLLKIPVTGEEEMFVVFLILHLSSTYSATKAGFFKKLHGLRRDIETFFALPIPDAVWEKVRDMQEPDFVRFVEECRISDLEPD